MGCWLLTLCVILQCNPGSFADKNGTVECTKCIAGTVQPASKQTRCENCLVGEAQETEGQSYCTECEAVSYTHLTLPTNREV